jgi:hypothetical protein
MSCGDLPGKHCGVPVTKLLGGRISAAVQMARTKIKILHTPDAVSGEHPSIKPLATAREGFSMNTAVLCEAHRRDAHPHQHSHIIYAMGRHALCYAGRQVTRILGL